MKIIKCAALLIILLFSASCEKKPDERENNSYNAYFVYPVGAGEKKVYVGTVTGLSSCKYIVSSHYAKRRKFVEGPWDYECCLRAGENECAETHRYGE